MVRFVRVVLLAPSYLRACALCILLLAGSQPAHASPAQASPFAVTWVPELALTAGALLMPAFMDAAVAPSMRAQPACRLLATGSCDPGGLLAIDRWALRAPSAAWRRSSDVLQISSLGLSLVMVAVQAVVDGRGALGDAGAGPPKARAASAIAAAQDVLVATEAIATATFVTTVLKYAVRRPRPGQYRGVAGTGIAQGLSFPSGHTAAVASASFALASITQLRRPHSAWARVAWASAVVLTAATATGRVNGGKHFPTDVAAGAVLGAAFGVAMPALHRRQLALQVSPTFAGGAGLQLHATF